MSDKAQDMYHDTHQTLFYEYRDRYCIALDEDTELTS